MFNNSVAQLLLKALDIPTKEDIQLLMAKIERIERLIKTGKVDNSSIKKNLSKNLSSEGEIEGELKPKKTGANVILSIIQNADEGITFNEIKKKSGFEEKRIRNIIFRLNKAGKVKNIRRGVYITQNL